MHENWYLCFCGVALKNKRRKFVVASIALSDYLMRCRVSLDSFRFFLFDMLIIPVAHFLYFNASSVQYYCSVSSSKHFEFIFYGHLIRCKRMLLLLIIITIEPMAALFYHKYLQVKLVKIYEKKPTSQHSY